MVLSEINVKLYTHLTCCKINKIICNKLYILKEKIWRIGQIAW